MRFLPRLLLILCLLLHSSTAKKENKREPKVEKKEKESYWENVLSDVYENAAEASAKLGKVSAEALKHVNEAVDTEQIARVASNAYTTAKDTAALVGQKAVEVSSAAYETVNAAIESGEVNRVASEALSSAAAAATQIGQKAAEASSTAYDSVNAALEERDLKTRAADAASDAVTAATGAVEVLRRSFSEASKGRTEGEEWSSYLKRVAPALSYGEEIPQEMGTEGEETSINHEKKHASVEEYVLFWRALNGTSWKQSLTEFAQRFYYENDENEKRAVNNGYAAALSTLAGSFSQINEYGRGAIYRLASGQGWAMRQVNTAGRQAIYKPSLFGTAFSQFGSVFWYGSVLAEGVNVMNAAAKDLDEGTSVNTVRASSKAAASWAAAAVGASTGATLLSPVPIVGPLVGGIVGGIAGAYSGEIAGDAVANAYADAFRKEQN